MLLSSRSTASVRASGRAAPAPRRMVRVLAHGHGHGGGHGHGHGSSGTAVLTEKDKGFIAEMRKVAMKLHTKDQAPKEGEKEAPKQGPWTPTRPGYLRFLVESKEVFDTFERLVNSSDAYKALRNTGLERGPGLAADIAWMEQSFQLAPPDMKPDGAAATYVAFLEKLAKTDPPAFICHYYNFYFAHTAGGRMIGNKVSSMLLDGQTLEFYKWQGDVNEHLEGVRKSINVMAEGWTPAEKEHCLAETESSFKYSGQILRAITEA